MAKSPSWKDRRMSLWQKLQTEYLSGTWSTYREAASRHGVPVAVISSIMKKIKLEMAEALKEQRETEIERTLAQIERVIGKATEAYEISRKHKSTCRTCKGSGAVDGKECPECEGLGWVQQTRPGNPAYLAVILKALEQKQKIFGMWPQKPTEIKQMLLVGGKDNPLLGAPSDVLIRAQRLVLEAKKMRDNGSDEPPMIVDAEVNEEKRDS